MKLFDKVVLANWLNIHGKVSGFGTDNIEVAWNILEPWLFLELDKVNYSISIDDAKNLLVEGKGSGITIPLVAFIEHGKILSSIKHLNGYISFRESFKNPEQFLDTLFEIRCINFCKNHLETTNFEISPKTIKNGKYKFPDFKFAHKGQDIFCECKSLETINRAKASKVFKLMEEVKENLQPMFGKYRMEIAFDNLPSHWNRNFGEQLASAFKVLIDNNKTNIHLKLNITHNHKTTLVHLAIADFMRGQLFKGLSIGDVSGPDGSKSNILITEFFKSKRSVKKAIQDACTQLPDNQMAFIFINPLDKNGFLEASNEFLNSQRKNAPKVISVIEQRDNDFTFVTSSRNSDLITFSNKK